MMSYAVKTICSNIGSTNSMSLFNQWQTGGVFRKPIWKQFCNSFFTFVAQKPYNLPNTNFGAIKSKAFCDYISFSFTDCWSDSINLMNGVIIGPGVSQVWMCENKTSWTFFHVFGENYFVKYCFPLFFFILIFYIHTEITFRNS